MRPPLPPRRAALALSLAAVAACGTPPLRTDLALAPVPVADPASPTRILLAGRIVLGETLINAGPLAGATIAVVTDTAAAPLAQATSTADGGFTLPPVAAGTYLLRVTVPREGGRDVTRTVTARLRPVRLTLPEGGGRLALELHARTLPGSARLISAVDLIAPVD
jgi:hypothetical protein